MIVVGINIALWFEGWFDDLKDAETEQQYLAGLRDDLASDLKLLDSVIESNSAKLQKIGEIVADLPNLGDADPEVQAQAIFTPSSYFFFEPATLHTARCRKVVTFDCCRMLTPRSAC